MPAQRAAALGAARRQVPEAGAEVGAAEHRVGGQPEHRERQAELARITRFTGPSTSVSGGRRASRRSSQTTVAASAR